MKVLNLVSLLWLTGLAQGQSTVDYGLDPNAPPGDNFDLLGWYVGVPVPDPEDGFASEVKEKELDAGYESEYFYTGEDGAMVFWTNGNGVKTSNNTMFIRSELRGMLRRGDTSIGTKDPGNNWAFSSIPAEDQHMFRGIDGELKATLAVNHVMETGTNLNWSGRIIIGQIHAANNEPCRLYYQKLPNNTKGALYFGHELSVPLGGDDFYYNLLGNMADPHPADQLGVVQDASDPEDGIALGEIFKYSIKVVGNELTVTIYAEDDTQLAQQVVDMSSSGYDVTNDYMYFKAGLYLQDNTFELEDYAQVSFYELEATHDYSQYVRDYGLDPEVPPSSNFDLSTWKINEPTPDPEDGWAFEVQELELVGWESDYFYTGEDGAMVFWSNGYGTRTSNNTMFIRSELREMLRAGDYSYGCCEPGNNWIFSSIPEEYYSNFRGVNGKMTATVSVDHVMETGTNLNWQGRIIIGQIHSRNNEPIRLYYQKLPNNTKGALYFGHEYSTAAGGADYYYNLLGNMAEHFPEDFLGVVQDASDPVDGMALGERFRYIIEVDGFDLTCTIQSEDRVELASVTVDMTDANYTDPTSYMYFKAGLYLQDNTFDLEDYAQVSFYELETWHDTSYYKPDYGLDPEVPPSSNFDLSTWKINEPTPDPEDGWASEVQELELVGWESDYFYTGEDGAMVFWSNGYGTRTSNNTMFIRSELREMLRAGDYSYGCCEPGNNWIFSSIPEEYYSNFRGVNGKMTATVSVDHVMETGTNLNWQGRIIIGQIHSRNNEPIRLYYQKLPNNTKGALYFGHEYSTAAGGADYYYNLLGNMAEHFPEDFLGVVQDASDPVDGMALGEKFRYIIEVDGFELTCTIQSEDRVELASVTVDMTDANYTDPTSYMYFKAGLYLQDNTFDPEDYAQVSFYELETWHDTSYYKPDYGLDPEVPPSSNFDLSTWKINEPTPDPEDGWASEVQELELVGWESDYFYTGEDGAMVFWSNGYGTRTSNNTMFIRSELREMLRAGDYSYGCCEPGNNWIFSSIPEEYYSNFRGVNGKMTATVSVDHVMETGTNLNWQGRIIIGQIHSRNNEPIRLYYQKLPNNTKGALYFGHEYSTAAGGADYYYNLLGNMAEHFPEDFLGVVQDASDPVDGMALGEKFRYIIEVDGFELTCTIQSEDRVELASVTVDMTDANYTDPTSYMYFKAGLYLQDNTFDPEDYAQVSFYELETWHDTQYYVAPSKYGLDPDAPPGDNFDLLGWYIGVPVPDPEDGFASEIKERELDAGFESEYFYTGEDGAMVFWTNGNGVKTSNNTMFIRSELRGMLRHGDTSVGTKDPGNNWAFSSIPAEDQHMFRAIDGELKATLAVNHVMTTGTNLNWSGRIIIGQIHAANNEPCRLYYQKLPNNTKGALYFGHELSVPLGGDDFYYNLLGNMADPHPADQLGVVQDASDPEDGIALGEIFKYSIKVVGNELTVTIYAEDDTQLAQQVVDMSSSGYDVTNDYMYFKAGLYLQDNTFELEDYAQVSFYELEAIHDYSQYDYGLDPEVPPSSNFDLSTWKINEPTPDPEDGWAFEVQELELVGWESDYFYTGEDGAMVFWSNGYGTRTSNNTMFIRSELREMLRAGDYSFGCCEPGNNWIFSSIPEEYYSNFRGVNGKMSATLSVDHVMETGTNLNWQGRIIIGQIHSRNNEPIRLYYQKLPNNTKGALYFGHEYSTAAGGADYYYNLLGNMAEHHPDDFLGVVQDASDPVDGIALGEKFRYVITVDGFELTCSIESEDYVELASVTVDMTDANYTDPTSYMYFKAGLYLQDNTFDPEDYAQVSFYELVKWHDTQYYVAPSKYDLDPNAPPGDNFDLLGWYVGVPVPDPEDGFASEVKEKELDAGYESEYFYTGEDGAMVFWTNGNGVKTSNNTMFIRSELRGMLRRGDTSIGTKDPGNNWAFSSIPAEDQHMFRGIDGELKATLAVNHVMETGTNLNWSGRIIIGQIHAANNEPCRLYYQKLPNNTKGALYFGHELSVPLGGDDFYYNLLGNMADPHPADQLGVVQDASDPEDGIALGEIFKYSIKVVGNELTVTIYAEDDTQLAQQVVDMSSSGYDVTNDYMYFKAGLYLQDNTFELEDYAQVSFYELEATHDYSQYVRDYGLDPEVPPSSNFDLSTWKINEPTPDPEDGWASEVQELELVGWESEFFYTGDDGAMVFYSHGEGARTSNNTMFIRSELREMLRAGDYSYGCCEPGNNWIFSSIPEEYYSNFRGVNGKMTATVSVDHVMETGTNLNWQGRIIIGQIHSRNNEPIRLYYQKLPNNTKGALYFGHEYSTAAGGADYYYNLLGNMAEHFPEDFLGVVQDASDPVDGIALGEKFRYIIEVDGFELTCTIQSEDRVELASVTVDMTDANYTDPTSYMYFKAGLYLQDNTFDLDDYAQVSFYELETWHDTSYYNPSGTEAPVESPVESPAESPTVDSAVTYFGLLSCALWLSVSLFVLL